MSIEKLNTEHSGIVAQKAQMAKKFGDLNSLKNIKKSELTDDKKQQIEKASRGFESIFVNKMLQEMKKAMLEEKDDNGFGGNTMMEMADMNLADQISNQGRGIGIAQMMYKQLTGERMPSNHSISSTPETKISNNDTVSRIINRIEKYNPIIEDASMSYGLPTNLIKSVIAAESAGVEDAVSSAGAKGLMQLMDGTASSLGVRNSFDPVENINGGTNYLNKMLNKYDGSLELALAAYNAGPGNVDKYNGVPPFNETNQYIDRVLRYNSLLKD